MSAAPTPVAATMSPGPTSLQRAGPLASRAAAGSMSDSGAAIQRADQPPPRQREARVHQEAGRQRGEAGDGLADHTVLLAGVHEAEPAARTLRGSLGGAAGSGIGHHAGI